MKKLLVLLLTVLMALSLAACGGSSDSSDAGDDETAVAAIKIGGSGPLTGAAAQYGIAVKTGAQIAVDEINAKGGLQLELNFLDDQADGEQATSAYAQLMDWGMQVSMLCTTTGSSLAVADSYNDAQIFAMTPSGSASDIIANKEYVYRMCFADPEQGTAAADMIVDKKIGEKVAIFVQKDDEYSSGVAEAFKTEAEAVGLEVVAEYAFTADNATDFSAGVKQAQDANADVVFLPLYYENDTKIILACDDAGYEPAFFGVDGFDGALEQTGVDVAIFEDVYYLTPFAYSATDAATVAFTTEFNNRNGANPNQFAADGYDVVYAIYNALVDTGCTADMTAQEISAKLVEWFQAGNTYSGLTGSNMTWSADGAVEKAPLCFQIKSGSLVAVD